MCSICGRGFEDEPNTIRMYDGVCDKCSKKLYKKELKEERRTAKKNKKLKLC